MDMATVVTTRATAATMSGDNGGGRGNSGCTTVAVVTV